MSPEEQALAAKEPTFADLCDQVRETRKAHLRAIRAVEMAVAHVNELRMAMETAHDAANAAGMALDAFIDRECAVERC